MDRFSLETASLAGKPASYLKFWGELPPSETVAVLECQNCHQVVDSLSFFPEYECDMCPSCRDEAMSQIVNDGPVTPACPVRFELAEGCTSYEEFRTLLRAHKASCLTCNPVRKPVARAMSELMQSEVA